MKIVKKIVKRENVDPSTTQDLETKSEWHANKFDKFLYWYGAVITVLCVIYSLSNGELSSVLIELSMSVVAVISLIELRKTDYVATSFLPKLAYCWAWFVGVLFTVGFVVGFLGAMIEV